MVDCLHRFDTFYKYSIRTRIKTPTSRSPCGDKQTSISIPLEQGLRHLQLVRGDAVILLL